MCFYADHKKAQKESGTAQRLRVSYVGGNANNGSNDGLGYRNVNNGLGNSNVNIGGRPNAVHSPHNYSVVPGTA